MNGETKKKIHVTHFIMILDLFHGLEVSPHYLQGVPVPQRTESRDADKYRYTSVSGSIIHNGQKIEKSPSTDEQIKAVCIYVRWNTAS